MKMSGIKLFIEKALLLLCSFIIKAQSGDSTVRLLRGYLFLRFLIFFPLLLTLVVTSGQDKTLDERYNEIYHNIFSSGPQGALEVADSLYRIAADDEQRMRSLMLIATIEHGVGNISEVLFQVTRAQEIAKKGHHKDWKARTTGFLENIYRLIGVMEEAKKGFEQADKLNESQKDQPSYFLTKANILQEKAHIAMYEELPALTLDYLKEAQSYIEQNRHNPERAMIVRSINLQMEAVCYIYLNKVTIADSIFQLANTILDNQNSMLLPYIYRGRAESGAFFLDKEVSLEGLAIIRGTNPHYTSYIIRKYRKMDFSTYLKHMRINYIINRIRLEPELSDYKLSYLAKLAGFPNHCKFSAVFKCVAGIPPSVFIHYTKEKSLKRKELIS